MCSQHGWPDCVWYDELNLLKGNQCADQTHTLT